MKALVATIFSLSLVVSPASVFAANGSTAPAPAPAAQPAQPQTNANPKIANDTGNAQDVAKKKRNHKIVVGLITAGVIVGAIAAGSGGSGSSSNSGTSGTTGT